jgi:hypothetical protein
VIVCNILLQKFLPYTIPKDYIGSYLQLLPQPFSSTFHIPIPQFQIAIPQFQNPQNMQIINCITPTPSEEFGILFTFIELPTI